MENNPKPTTLIYLASRLFAGGYLLYTAWNLRDAISKGILFIVAIIAFGIIGALLVVHSGLKICKGEYEGGVPFFQTTTPTTTEDETQEEPEEEME